MNRWLLGVIAYSSLMPLAMCHAHRPPISVRNDTAGIVRIDLVSRKAPQSPDLNPTEPGVGFGVRGCAREWDFIYLSTSSHPAFVAYRMNDICDPDDCSCKVRVSHLEKRRRDLSTPWEKADIFPPGAQIPEIR